MSPRQQIRVTDASTVPYCSTACRMGTHPLCTESSPVSAPVDLPVVYETCACLCHSIPGRSEPREVQR